MDFSEIMRMHGGIYFVTSGDFGISQIEGAKAALRGGVKIIQYREKRADTKVMIDEAQKIKQMCKKYGAIFLIDDRIDIALAVDADGVHIGDDDMPLKLAKEMFPGKIIGVSAKNAKQAKEAQRGGASYLGAGAIFPTATKVKTIVIGMEGFDEVRKSTTLPVYGIGGLKLEHVAEIRKRRADGMAVISAIAAANNPVKAAKELVDAWNLKA